MDEDSSGAEGPLQELGVGDGLVNPGSPGEAGGTGAACGL